MYKYQAVSHIKECNVYCQQSADNTERMLQFVLGTIQQQLETVPAILESFAIDGSNSKYAFGSKRHGLDYIATHKVALFELATKHKTSAENLLAVFLQVPGLGLVKAGFACQMFAGLVGCLDTHNITLYGVPLSSLRYNKKAHVKTQTKKIANYVALCESLGGCAWLWSRWCDYKASLIPHNWIDGGFSVSMLHIEALRNDYQHNLPRGLMDITDAPKWTDTYNQVVYS